MTKQVLMIGMLAGLLSACVSTDTQLVLDGKEFAMHRKPNERLADFGIERVALQNIAMIDGVEAGNHRVAVNAFRQEVLLTGEVPTEEIKQEIGLVIGSIPEVRHLYNYLTVVGKPKGQSHSFHEQYIKSKIDGKLLLQKRQEINPNQYRIVVRDDVSYVMGVLTRAQQEEIVESIRNAGGINKAVLLNTLVQVEFEGLHTKISEIEGDLSAVHPANRLIPTANANVTNVATVGAVNTNTANTNVAAAPNGSTTNVQSVNLWQSDGTTPVFSYSPTTSLSDNVQVFPNIQHNVQGYRDGYAYLSAPPKPAFPQQMQLNPMPINH